MPRWTLALMVLCLLGGPRCAGAQNDLVWSELPSLPDTVGLAGAFVGVSNGALLVAGGANFPDGRPWTGAAKVWHDRVYVLTDPAGPWLIARTRLPRPLGYGVAGQTERGVICVGGSGPERHHADCCLLEWTGGDIRVTPLSPLPIPLANGCGAVVGRTLYVAGGTDSPTATQCRSEFLALDLTADNPHDWSWTNRPTWPGSERMLAVAGTVGEDFLLVGGMRLRSNDAGQPERIKPFLRDAYRYRPTDRAWTRLAELPAPRAAGPSPALEIAPQQMALFGGDDGSPGVELQDAHPGFPPEIFLFDAAADRWTVRGGLPKRIVGDPARDPAASVWAPVTTGTARWYGRVVIPTGEARPGVRTPRVLVADPR
jgi:N-acetylneuraminic acid mutarotase